MSKSTWTKKGTIVTIINSLRYNNRELEESFSRLIVTGSNFVVSFFLDEGTKGTVMRSFSRDGRDEKKERREI